MHFQSCASSQILSDIFYINVVIALKNHLHITNCIATCLSIILTVYFKSILPQLHAVITPSPLRNGCSTYLQLSGDGFAEAASTALCSLFVRAQQAGLHNPDRERRGYFFRREKQEAWRLETRQCALCSKHSESP